MQTIVEQIQALSKEELVELFTGNWILSYHTTQRHITEAKGAVLRKKAEAAWKEYEAFQLPTMPDKPSLQQNIEWLQAMDKQDALHKKYEKLWKQADKLQYGR